jgi:hypothetical protein
MLKALYSYTIGNEVVVATFIGAFTAAIMGMLTSVYIERRKKINEQNKYCRIISNELDNILRRIKSLDLNSKEGRSKGKLITSNNWLLAKSVLFEVLIASEINTIDRFYSVAEMADSLIESELSLNTFAIDMTSFDPQYIKQLLYNDKMEEEVYKNIDNIINKLKK